MKRLINIILFLITLSDISSGQVSDRNRLIQVNGIVTDDENHPVPHVSVISTRLRRGTVSEYTGIYSLISVPGDTVFISALGFKKMTFQVPAGIEGRLYKKDITLVSDTISIEGVNIFPWKNYQEFKREVLANQPVMKPEIRFMYENLASIRYTLANTPAYSSSPDAAYRLSVNQQADNVVTRGQTPYNNLLNPIAWAKFFSGVKNGLLKNQKTTQTTKKAKVRNKKSNED